MSTYKLLYLNGRGRGEPIRYIFALADQEYVDERIDWDFDRRDTWLLEVKPNTIWGVLPELTIDDQKPICQTSTICKALGDRFGLMGRKGDEIYIDMLMGCGNDLIYPLDPIFTESNKTKRAEMTNEYGKIYPDWFRRLEGFLCTNKNGEGWFVGDSITVADVFLYSCLTWFPYYYPNCMDGYPKLDAFMKRFESHPKIAAWIEKRPKTFW